MYVLEMQETIKLLNRHATLISFGVEINETLEMEIIKRRLKAVSGKTYNAWHSISTNLQHLAS
jgi:hypothetical protein